MKQPQLKSLGVRSRPVAATVILFGGLAAVLLGLAASIAVGAKEMTLSTIWDALTHFDRNSESHQIVWEMRLPRAIAGGGGGSSAPGWRLRGRSCKT